MKKILILIGNAGAGHITCARAVEDSFKRLYPDSKVKIIDVFSLSVFSRGYDFTYFLVSKISFFEKLFNLSCILIDRSEIFTKIYSFFVLSHLFLPTRKLIQEEKPDLVICNNALVCEVVGKCRKVIDFNFVITVPDLISVSRWWAQSSADLITCPTLDSSKRINDFDSQCNTVYSYYPLREVNIYPRKEALIKKKSMFDDMVFNINTPTILITGCGVATSRIVENLIEYLKRSSYQFIILTGRDELLKKRLKIRLGKYSNVCIKGYTNYIFDYFTISDLIIAKPGPATVLEIERFLKKAIFTKPIGYQEWGNVEYLERNPNFEFVGDHFDLIPKKIEELLKREKKEYVSYIQGADVLVKYLLSFYSF